MLSAIDWWQISLGAAIVIAVVVAAVFVLYKVLEWSTRDMFNGALDDDSGWLTEADGKQIAQGLFQRHWLDDEVVVKVFNRETLERFYGAVFDDHGDIVDLKNKESTRPRICFFAR